MVFENCYFLSIWQVYIQHIYNQHFIITKIKKKIELLYQMRLSINGEYLFFNEINLTILPCGLEIELILIVILEVLISI